MKATEWIGAFAATLGLEAPHRDAIRQILALAGEAAHDAEPSAAPVACWLAAQAGLSPAEALTRLRQRKPAGSPSEGFPDAAAVLDLDVRLHIFRQVATRATVPNPDDIAAALGQSREAVDASLRRLEADRMIVLAPGTTNIWTANPFAGVPAEYKVIARGRTYWAVCMWDALGIPAALDADATILTHCGDCGAEMACEVRGGSLALDEGIVHCAVPAVAWWDNIVFT